MDENFLETLERLPLKDNTTSPTVCETLWYMQAGRQIDKPTYEGIN